VIALDNHLGLAHFFVWTVGLVIVCYGLSRRYPWTVCLAFGFTAFSALRIYQAALNGIPVNPVVRDFIRSSEAAMISFLLTVMVVQALPVRTWTKIFKGLAILNALAICADSFFFTANGLWHHLPWALIREHEPWGLLLNASMSGCFSAVLFHLFAPREKALRAFLVISILVAGRSLPVAVLFCGIGASLFAQRRYRALSLAVLASFAVGFLLKGRYLLDPRGRDFVWSLAFAHFRDHLPWSVGGGLGSFYVVGPALSSHANAPVFVWLHSDWFQTLFEQGVIGFVLVAAMYAHALWQTRKTSDLFPTLTAYAAFGVANMPLRYPLSGLLGAFLIRWALEKSEKEKAPHFRATPF
jgi:hypothetical protein